ncbi:MAG: GMC oxidoreductase [Pseudomonadota bacterium]
MKLSPNVARPRSRGHVQLSGPKIDASPVIELNYFSDRDGYDRRTLIGGLRFARQLAETQSLAPFLKREISPGIDVTNDDELFSYIRETCETVYHPAGTCRMGDLQNAETVVGPDLAVKGLAGLRIADASVFPDMVTVNICNTVMMVAERAAEIIQEAYSV